MILTGITELRISNYNERELSNTADNENLYSFDLSNPSMIINDEEWQYLMDEGVVMHLQSGFKTNLAHLFGIVSSGKLVSNEETFKQAVELEMEFNKQTGLYIWNLLVL